MTDLTHIKCGVAHEGGKWWVIVKLVDTNETYDDIQQYDTREEAEKRMREFIAEISDD